MCGRYDNLIAREAYRALFRAERLPDSNFPPRYNVAQLIRFLMGKLFAVVCDGTGVTAYFGFRTAT